MDALIALYIAVVAIVAVWAVASGELSPMEAFSCGLLWPLFWLWFVYMLIMEER